VSQPMNAERSRDIQSQLAAIDGDREAFVNDMLSQWSRVLDPEMYDLEEDLKPIAMAAPAWQVYGASLVGDFKTMVQVLRGVRGAGPYINALLRPEAKRSPGQGQYTSTPLTRGVGSPISRPYAIGDTSNQLVFTPIAPCRVVDTRGAGARTGVIAAEASRTFDLTTEAFTSGQGVSGPCTGLPSLSHYAWSVNITVTGYGGVGGLKAWPYGGTEPNASIINYSTTLSPAIANGLTLTGCYGCANDITIKAFSAATHVIIDVAGYYQEATGTSATVTAVVGTPVAVPGGAGSSFVDGGICPAGTVLVGGQVSGAGGPRVFVGENFGFGTGTYWRYLMFNYEAAAETIYAYSLCMDAPIVF